VAQGFDSFHLQRWEIFKTTSRDLPAPPQRGDHRREQRSGKPIEKSPEDNKRMQINENRALHYDWQSEDTPAHESNSDAATNSCRKELALIVHYDCEKKSDAACGEDVQRTGKKITKSRLSAPSARSQLLKSVKNHTHPQPAREDRENTGDEAGNERLRKMQAVHGANAIVTDIAGFRQRSKL
jgi:hypothetical protein